MHRLVGDVSTEHYLHGPEKDEPHHRNHEKNMYAVVEPYVITAQLQAELFKRGCHMNLKGAGANCTAMLRGHGHLDQTTSGDDRNHLAIEWVTPERKHCSFRFAGIC